MSRRFHKNPGQFADAFARAWFKLTHRDMGLKARYLGPDVPKEDLIWQDPIPAVDHKLVTEKDIEGLKKHIMASGLKIPALVKAAWASASTFRGSDMRGGANGARIRLDPMKDWKANGPAELRSVLNKLSAIQKAFNAKQKGGKKISLADMIVLGDAVAVEEAAKDTGHKVSVPLRPGRADASQKQTDVDSFSVLEPFADGFRNYQKTKSPRVSAEELLVDKAQLLTLLAPEMTVLVGGMRALGANAGNTKHGVFTNRPGQLTNDFFVNVLDLGTTWAAADASDQVFEGRDRATDKVKWTGTRVDLIFGSNSELRALAEVYATDDAGKKFVQDFIQALGKVMELDRFDLN